MASPAPRKKISEKTLLDNSNKTENIVKISSETLKIKNNISASKPKRRQTPKDPEDTNLLLSKMNSTKHII